MKKIVVIGPESTGKSTLCESLAKHFNAEWCPEYARTYLLKHGTAYQFENLLTIAEGQLKQEDEFTEHLLRNENKTNKQSTAKPLLIDTDMYVMKVWCEFVFQNCHPFILNQIVQRKYDLYLLCNVDLPWVKDELREYPDLVTREKLYHIYRDIMINQSVPWIDISGNYEERLQKGIRAVQALLDPGV